MAHKHRTGPVRPLEVPVLTSAGAKVNDIAVGDLLAYLTNGACPAQNFTWTTDLTTTRQNFAAAFLGIASGRSVAANTLDLRDINVLVAQDGDYSFDTDASGAIAIGTLLAPKKAAGNALTQVLIPTTVHEEAVAVCTKAALSTDTVVWGSLLNTMIKRANLA